jgi:hypothetical protein
MRDTTKIYTRPFIGWNGEGLRPMKSNKQRRQEIKAQRAARQARHANARPVDHPVGVVVVTPARLRPTNSYGVPDFVQRGYYQDRPFRCKDCGKAEVWTAAQQQWWYEEAQGDVWTTAGRCRTCRQHERVRKVEARRVHLVGLMAKRARIESAKPPMNP